MNTKKYLVLIRDNNDTYVDKTKQIKSCIEDMSKEKYLITFASSGISYKYGRKKVKYFTDPDYILPSTVRVYRENKELFNIKLICNFNNKYIHIIFDNENERTYKYSDLIIQKNGLLNPKAKNTFDYFYSVANEISLKTETDYRILGKQYSDMNNFLPETTVASKYLNQTNINKVIDNNIVIFPFGTNASQSVAVRNALSNDLSVIEGPPGTGKTQTILNIIANLIIRDKSVEVVSNNNSATDNVYEKLKKYNYEFIAAPLGKRENKEKFIENQIEKYPDMFSWILTDSQYYADTNNITDNESILNELFSVQIKLQEEKQKLSDNMLEQKYFEQYCDNNEIPNIECKKETDSKKLLEVLNRIELASNLCSKIIIFLKTLLIFGLKNIKTCFHSYDVLSAVIKRNYYRVKISEQNESIEKYNQILNDNNLNLLVNSYVESSRRIFENYLARKYSMGGYERKQYTVDELWFNSRKFVSDYPVILSTTYSARSNLGNYIYDYVIMDESSQVDVVTATVAMSVANNAVIVGDRKQLPNVVTDIDRLKTDIIKTNFNVDYRYDFSKYSFLSSVCEIFKDIPTTLLREHYRCHPKIINFCNKEFYDNQLVIMTNDNNEPDVLRVYKTVEGNHARGHENQRQIDIIKNTIIPSISSSSDEVGIIAPYRKQISKLKSVFSDCDFLIETVHKFQGREKDIMIMSTVDNILTDFSDDPNLLNVAVSRAKNQFILVTDSRKENLKTHIGDFIRYIEYNNFQVIDSDIYSVFDNLYSQYYKNKIEIISNSKNISDYDSEILMYNLIVKVLSENYDTLGVVCHLPLKEVFKNISKLCYDELKFVKNTDSHVDFMIYNKVSKMPILAIEVDGYRFHNNAIQKKRDIMKNSIFSKYSLPILRFSTDGSAEEEKLLNKLYEIL